MLYLFTHMTHTGERPGSSDSTTPLEGGATFSSTVVEDEVDQLLYKEDGRIHRNRDEQL